MCDVDYLSQDLEKLTSKCSCFLYDVHDPDSCSMGAVFLASNFGGGQDPWLYASFFATLFTWLMILRQARKNSVRKLDEAAFECKFRGDDEGNVVALDVVVFEEKLWGWWCLGGGSFMMFVVMFVSRLVFAFGSRDISRLVNVFLYPVFSISLLVTMIGLVNCWWVLQFKKEMSGEGAPTQAPFPGVLRHTALLMGVDTGNKKVNELGHWICLFFEASLALMAVCFLFTSLAVSIGLSNASSSEFVQGKLFIVFSAVYNIIFLLFIIDSIFAITVHRYHGIRLFARTNPELCYVKDDGGLHKQQSGFLSGREQSYISSKANKMVLVMLFCTFIFSVLTLRLVGGYCPYITYDEDIYHGGDPAEAAQGDLMSFLILYFYANEVSIYSVFDSYRWWKPEHITLPEGQRVLGDYDHPNKVEHSRTASMVSAVLVCSLAICTVVMDWRYKQEAGMVGRILYFCGFLITLSILQDLKLLLIIMDTRTKAVIPLRVLAAITIGWMFCIFVAAAVKSNDDITGNLDIALFLGALLSVVLKFIIVQLFQLIIFKTMSKAEHEAHQKEEIADLESQGFNANAIEMKAAAAKGSAGDDADGTDTCAAAVIVDGGDNGLALKDDGVQLEEETINNGKSGLANHRKGQEFFVQLPSTRFLLLTDFANAISTFFIVWVFMAIVWNALAIVLVLSTLGIVLGHWFRHLLYVRQVTRITIQKSSKPFSDTAAAASMSAHACEIDYRSHVISTYNVVAIVCLQILVIFAFALFTQSWYFMGKPLPYYEPQILIAGHRGVWTKGYAENSIEGNRYAKNASYHCAEYDMRMTKDQQLVVMHDLTLERTTNGTGNVFDKDLDWLINNLNLKREGTEELLSGTPPGTPYETPYELDVMLKLTKDMGLISNIEVKQDKNMSAIALTLDSICRMNATQESFISTGDTRFQHLLYHLQPNITLEKDFLLYTPTMSAMVPNNVNIYAISAELALFNTWIIPNMHAAGTMVLIYFLALESPGMINYFVKLGVDGFMLNNPQNCIDAGQCPPKRPFILPRTM